MPHVAGEAEEVVGVHVVAPHHVAVLVVLLLELIDGLRATGVNPAALLAAMATSARWDPAQTRRGRNLVLRDGNSKQPGEVVLVVMLVIAADERLIPFALAMKHRMAQRRRLDAPVRRRMAVENIEPEFFADCSAIFE